MTKEKFEQELKNEVIFFKDKLENLNLERAKLEGFPSINFNPFLKYNEKFFNVKILSNLQGLYSFMDKHKELHTNEIALYIISNKKYITLIYLLNFNPYLINELKEGVRSPMDIAIAYAEHLKTKEKLKGLPRR